MRRGFAFLASVLGCAFASALAVAQSGSAAGAGTGPGAEPAAAASVFDRDRARAFCSAGQTGRAEACLSDQEAAGRRIDRWLEQGAFPRYQARHIYAHCVLRHDPDLRQVLLCVEEAEEDARRLGVPAPRGR